MPQLRNTTLQRALTIQVTTLSPHLFATRAPLFNTCEYFLHTNKVA